MKTPQVGDTIYVPSSYYVYRGEDDFEGGLATITKVIPSSHLPEGHINYWMVEIDNRRGISYNWYILMAEQEELKEEFGDQKAHPSPDTRPEFNQPNADWR